MPRYEPDARKLFYSRLWCWGSLVLGVCGFTVCSVIPLPDEGMLFFYLAAGLLITSTVTVILAELDYRKNIFALSDNSVSNGDHEMSLEDIDDLTWQCGIAHDDNGGCLMSYGDRRIVIRFDYLSDRDALECVKTLREAVPADLQLNWPAFCHAIGLRLFYAIHHPGRKLPAPAEDEAHAIKEFNKRGQNFLLCFLFGGFAIAMGAGALLEWLGVPNAIPWSLGLFIAVRLIGQAIVALYSPTVARRFEESQRIWLNDVMTDAHSRYA